jgi:CheY-like chemotaxis protein
VLRNGACFRLGILDDNEDARMFLRLWLEGEGFDVHEYTRKGEFLSRAKTDAIDLALIDLWLPDGSGLDLPIELETLLARPIPLIAVTADAMPGVIDKVRGAGFSAYITKPIDFETLGLEIRRLLT